MATFIMFSPAIELWPARFEVRDFKLGDAGKNADGRALPPHLRRIWTKNVRHALVYLADPIVNSDADRQMTPQRRAIERTVENRKVFPSVVVFQPQRRITMNNVRIARFTMYIDEPLTLELTYERMVERKD